MTAVAPLPAPPATQQKQQLIVGLEENKEPLALWIPTPLQIQRRKKVGGPKVLKASKQTHQFSEDLSKSQIPFTEASQRQALPWLQGWTQLTPKKKLPKKSLPQLSESPVADDRSASDAMLSSTQLSKILD